MSNIYKNLGIWILIGLVLFILFNFINTTPQNSAEISFTEFMSNVQARRVDEVTIRGGEIAGIYDDRSQFQTHVPDYPEFIPFLLEHGVRIRAQSATQGGLLLAILNSWFPMLLIIGVWLFFMRQVQGGGNQALSFGKIRARRADEKNNPITFKDVAGIDESKEELKEIVEFLQDPQKFERLGGQIPRGGPPRAAVGSAPSTVRGE